MDVIIVFVILVAAMIMFSTERIRNDVASIIIMLSLAWTKVIDIDQVFIGFSSNAVIAIIGVMIIGYGIEKTGIMNDLANMIIQKVGSKENIIVATIMALTGVISSFLQNIGAVALFLPAVKKISSKSGVNSQRLIMPMAFSGILGGTLTLVASGPLIILNDLLSEGGLEAYGMFSVTPIGIGLLITGILYFFFFSKIVLPSKDKEANTSVDKLSDIYDLPNKIYEVDIESNNELVGKTIEELNIWNEYGIHILAISESDSKVYIPWRETTFKQGQTLALFGEEEEIDKFFNTFDMKPKEHLVVFKELSDDEEAGFAEIILLSDSSLRGKTLKEIALRKNYKIEPIIYFDNDAKRLSFVDWQLQPGLKVIVFGRWADLARLKESKEFVVISQIKTPESNSRANKKIPALIILAGAIVSILFGVPLPVSFLTAAILMLFTKVILKEELYKAIDWKTVFLLAGLIPLGIAFDQSGAASLVAETIISIIESWPVPLILLAIGLITSFFSLFMSNVAATVLLVPLILIMGESFGLDPRGLALFVAVTASNSFILPTHQVNAYVMTAGNYKNSDFIKAGGIMSILFLLVSTAIIYLLYI
jgi:di/tricarboxylate transporter